MEQSRGYRVRHPRAGAVRRRQRSHQARGKTVTKLVTPEEKQESLFKLVSGLTGYKNSLKGVGYFMGAALLDVSYESALHVNVALIVVALPFAVFGLTAQLGRVAKENITLRAVFAQTGNINWLSLARLFLFGSRDLWFEVPLPFYLRSAEGLGWPRSAVGAMLAGYIILYGQCQSFSPQLVLAPLKQSPPNKWVHGVDRPVGSLAAVHGRDDAHPGVRHPGRRVRDQDGNALFGVFSFAVVFAVNSAVHSYLVVKYSDGNKVAMNVGFYYMANAFGRLIGTITSGALYSYAGNDANDGLAACFAASFASSSHDVVTYFVDDDEGVAMGDQRRHEVFRRAAVGGSGGETRGGEESGRGGGGARVNQCGLVMKCFYG